jgi:hypothetical protein
VLEGGKWDGRVYLIDFGGVQGVANAGALQPAKQQPFDDSSDNVA